MKLFSITSKSVAAVLLLSMATAGSLMAEVTQNPATVAQKIKKTIEGVQSCNDWVIHFSLEDLSDLAKQGQMNKEAIAAAMNEMASWDPYVKIRVLEIFEYLVRQGQAFNEAFEVAMKSAQDEDFGVNMGALFLFATLVKQGQCYKQALEVAIKSMESTESIKAEEVSIRACALQLVTVLVAQGQAYKEAINLSIRGMNDKHYYVRECAIELLRAIVKQGAKKEVIKAAMQGMRAWDHGVRWHILEIFEDLVKQGQAFKEAKAAAIIGMQDSEQYVQDAASALLKALAEKQPQPTTQPAQQSQHQVVS